jgi:hypothetical protein
VRRCHCGQLRWSGSSLPFIAYTHVEMPIHGMSCKVCYTVHPPQRTSTARFKPKWAAARLGSWLVLCLGMCRTQVALFPCLAVDGGPCDAGLLICNNNVNHLVQLSCKVHQGSEMWWSKTSSAAGLCPQLRHVIDATQRNLYGNHSIPHV